VVHLLLLAAAFRYVSLRMLRTLQNFFYGRLITTVM
jgi:hypothetical protein